MSNHLDLAHEFPNLKEKIHQKKISDAHFERRFKEYNDLCQAIYRAEQRIDLLSEDAEEALRRKRLTLKDELYAALTA